MARVTDNDTAPPQIGRPVGSLEELQALGVPLRNICSCSERVPNKSAGCDAWEICDRSYRGTRPQLEVVRKVNRAGKVRIYQAPCFDTVRKEAAALDNKELYDIIGHEGDEYTYTGSVKKHETRDPNCNDCTHGRCEAYVNRNDLKAICGTFPLAEDHPELQQFAERKRALATTGVRQKEAIRESLLPGSEPGKVVHVNDKPRFGHGSRSPAS